MTQSLIQKLRDAASGSRELDLEIWALVGGWKLVTQPDSIEMRAEKYDGDVVSEWEAVAFWDSGGHVRVYHAFEEDLPRYSRSLDAIIGLIEEKLSDREWSTNRDLENRCFWATVADDNWDDSLKDHIGRSNASAPIALCLALLSALEGES